MLDMLGEKPEHAAPPNMLFSDAVRRWLEDVRHRVDEVTYQGYEVQLERTSSPTSMTCKSGCVMLTARRCRRTST